MSAIHEGESPATITLCSTRAAAAICGHHQSVIVSLLTTAAEVNISNVTWPLGDVIEARDRAVTSAEESRIFAQQALKPTSPAVAWQWVAFQCASHNSTTVYCVRSKTN